MTERKINYRVRKSKGKFKGLYSLTVGDRELGSGRFTMEQYHNSSTLRAIYLYLKIANNF